MFCAHKPYFLMPGHISWYTYATPTFITEVLHFITRIQLLEWPFQWSKWLVRYYLTLISSWCTSLLRPRLWIELFCYILKCSKLTQLDIQVQYHMIAIYSLGADTHTYWLHRQKKLQETRHAPAEGWCMPGLKTTQLCFFNKHFQVFSKPHWSPLKLILY